MKTLLFTLTIVGLLSAACGSPSVPEEPATTPAPADSIVLTWHREGGIAGFCDDLTVYHSGEVYASSCKLNAGASDGNPSARLSKEERAQLDKWLTAFGTVTVTMKDPATADAMTMTLTLNGSGTGQPTEAEWQALMAWAQDVYNRVKS